MTFHADKPEPELVYARKDEVDALRANLALARTIILSACVHIPFYGEGRACDDWHRSAKLFLKD